MHARFTMLALLGLSGALAIGCGGGDDGSGNDGGGSQAGSRERPADEVIRQDPEPAEPDAGDRREARGGSPVPGGPTDVTLTVPDGWKLQPGGPPDGSGLSGATFTMTPRGAPAEEGNYIAYGVDEKLTRLNIKPGTLRIVFFEGPSEVLRKDLCRDVRPQGLQANQVATGRPGKELTRVTGYCRYPRPARAPGVAEPVAQSRHFLKRGRQPRAVVAQSTAEAEGNVTRARDIVLSNLARRAPG